MKNIIRNEFSETIARLEEQNEKVRREMCELKTRHQVDLEKKNDEIERIRKEKDKELDEVHRRYDYLCLYLLLT